MKKKIYIAYTGGTIGMRASNNGYIPVAGYLAETLSRMPEFHRAEMPTFTLHEYPHLIDSSDMNPSHWNQIAEDIQNNYEAYDGFIILHGTDTMSYTASALSFMLENLEKPVIVTGSQIPLAELRSDGQVNLLNALYIAANYPIPEVSLFFNNKLLRGNRSRKLDADGFDAFDSPNFRPLLVAGINIELINGTVKQPASQSTLTVAKVESQPVGVITLYPGISADVLKNTLQQPVNAMILLSYGVGNAPQNNAILEQLRIANENDIVIVNCTQCLRGKVNMGGYATGHALQDVGVVSGRDMTPEAALAKLHYLLSKRESIERLRLQLSQNLKGELSLPDK
ncbi:asparaginase [Alteromonas sp. a30]|uniref:asparaginase n=1 Tax=Alteromonas sp. a30 TaxID=2730917 RepID=UPI00227E5CAB|nr:asparaginase [Alteromonas sp. a30]MCY7294019.1 asparaginase [Alteromonas sp. a30]